MADYEDTKVNNLVINNMSQEKYDELKAAGELDPTQVYLTPKVNALTEPYRLGYVDSNAGYYMQLTPLEDSDVAIDLMKSDGTKGFTAWRISTNGSATFSTTTSGISGANFTECKYTNQYSSLTCTLPNWSFVINQKTYLSFQTTKMPAASSSLTGIAATYIGDTDETFTKGHTYMVESDGAETPTYTWKDVYEGGGAALPDQTDNAGKFLTTDGTTASWGNALANDTDYNTSIGIGSKADSYNAVAVGTKISTVTNNSVTIGHEARTNVTTSVAIGYGTYAQNYSMALGSKMSASAEHSIQIGASLATVNNTDPNTFKVYNGVGNYEIMSADGTIPTDRYTITPTTAGTYVPKLTIAEDGTATREWGAESGGAVGDFLPLSGGTLTGDLNVSGTNSLKFDDRYTFKSAGSNSGRVVFGAVDSSGYFNKKIIFSVTGYGALLPANNQMTLGDSSAIWEKTYTTTINNGADISIPTTGGTMVVNNGVADGSIGIGKDIDVKSGIGIGSSVKVDSKNNIASGRAIAIGVAAQASTSGSTHSDIAIGQLAKADGTYAIAIGARGTTATAQYAIQLGSAGTNNDANTFKVANENGNFEMMDANGNVPLDRLTYVTDQIGDISTALTAILGE